MDDEQRPSPARDALLDGAAGPSGPPQPLAEQPIGSGSVVRKAASFFLVNTLSVTPRQSRALSTVDRIVAATTEIGLRDGIDSLNLKVIAAESKVGLKSVYRYFSAPDDIIRFIVRQRMIGVMEATKAQLQAMRFADTAALADHLAHLVTSKLADSSIVPQALKRRMVERYAEIAYGELNDMAAVVLDTLRRNGLPVSGPRAQTEIALSFAAVAASVRMALLLHPDTLRDGRLTRIVAAQLRLGLDGVCGRPEPLPTPASSSG